MTEITNQEWFNALIEECHAALTESIFTSRWALIEGYHHFGKRILEDVEKFKDDKDAVKRVANALNKSSRTIYQAVQFPRKFPNLDALPDGKNNSWHKIANHLLPEPKEKEQKIIELCPTCGKPL